ncbi:MAG TPA: lysine 2,3-aminomutase, partial [Xanthobacteraceae bacterium]|nr:lysine 2,3-aminomutase [Xanthobacteraceae bacterium]
MTQRTLHEPDELVAAGLLPPERLAAIARVAERYAVAITPAMTELINPGDPADPIARQFIPDPAELDVSPDERADP